MKPRSNFLGFLKSTKQQKINFKIWSNKGAAFFTKNSFFESCLKNHSKFIIKIINFLQIVWRIFLQNKGSQNNFVLLFRFPWQFYLQKKRFLRKVKRYQSNHPILNISIIIRFIKTIKKTQKHIVRLEIENQNVFLWSFSTSILWTYFWCRQLKAEIFIYVLFVIFYFYYKHSLLTIVI